MTEHVSPRRRGSYGIDAPFIDALLAGLVVLYLVLAIVTGRVVFWLVVLLAPVLIDANHWWPRNWWPRRKK